MRSIMPPTTCRYCTTQAFRSLPPIKPFTSPSSPLSFLLPRLHRPRLRCFLPVTPYHYHAQKAAYDRRGEKDENDRYTDSPDAGREEVVERVALVDEGLGADARISIGL